MMNIIEQIQLSGFTLLSAGREMSDADMVNASHSVMEYMKKLAVFKTLIDQLSEEDFGEASDTIGAVSISDFCSLMPLVNLDCDFSTYLVKVKSTAERLFPNLDFDFTKHGVRMEKREEQVKPQTRKEVA